MITSVKNLYTSLGRFRTLYLISAVEMIIIIIWSLYSGDGMVHRDTQNYYEAYHVIITRKPDLHRTPLFPLIIGSCRAIFGNIYSVAIVYIFQGILFLFSIKWMGDMLMNITAYRRISYWFTAIYALYPGIVSFCGVMMTESISISLVAGVLYLVSGAYRHYSSRKAILSGIVCLLLWMQRPSMICIPLLIASFYAILLFFKRKHQKVMLCGFVSTLMSIILLCLYSIMFNAEYNIKGVSAVSTWNNYMTIRGAAAIDIDNIDIPEIRMTVDSMLNIHGKGSKINSEWWDEMVFFHENFGMDTVSSFVNDQIKVHPKEIINYLYSDRMNDLIDADCVIIGWVLPFHLNSITRLFRVNNGTAFLIFILGLILLFYDNMRHKRVSYFEWLLFAMFAGNYFTVLVGAPNDFPRLLAQNYPILIIISCWVLSQLTWLGTKD